MKIQHWKKVGAAGCSLLLLQAAAHAQHSGADEERAALARRLDEQIERLDALRRGIAEQEAELARLRRAVAAQELGSQRGRGAESSAAPLAQSQQSVQAPSGTPAPASSPQQAATPTESESRPPEVAQIFEQPGVLTPRGKVVLEPSLQYSYSSNNRVALIGYTVVPALLIGLIDVREVKRNTVTAALSGRFGVTNRFELEGRIPYVYRSDTAVSREIATGTGVDRTFDTSGRALGDIELGARYQLNDGGVNKPFYIGTLRFKTRTGRDPFEVVTDCAQRCVGNTSGTGLPLQLPTGSGFYSLQAGLTWLLPSDPAVFFGSFSYLHNFKRDNVRRRVLNGDTEFLGTVSPGDVIGFNFGMGLALNERSTFSIGYDHNSVGRIRQGGAVVPGSVRVQLGTMLLGYSYRLNERRTLTVSVGAGLTRDTPDLSLGIKLPISY